MRRTGSAVLGVAAFLAGLLGLWAGLETITVEGPGARGLLCLGAGAASWLALAAVTARRARPPLRSGSGPS